MAQGTAEYPDVWRQNVLFRLKPGGNIQRATFSRASAGNYVNHSGVGQSATLNTLRVEWVDLDGDGIRETPGYLLEGARTQLNANPENFGAWAVTGTPVLTSGQADPFGGTAAYLLADDDAAAVEFIMQNVTYTGDATKAVSLFAKPGSLATQDARLRDTTAGASRHHITITWASGVPTLSTAAGAGVLFTPVLLNGGWYAIAFNANGVVAANNNRIEVFAGSAFVAGNVGNGYIFGVNTWNAPFASSYQGPTLAARSADIFTIPLKYGPCDLTVLARIARLAHADAGASTDLGLAPGIFGIGDTGPASGGQLRASFQQTSRNAEAAIDTPTTDKTGTAALIAGTQTLVAQYRNLTTSGGLTKIDAGGGFGTESTAATPFLSFNGANLHIGRTAAGSELFGVLLDLLVVRGLQTRQTMIALAGI